MPVTRRTMYEAIGAVVWSNSVDICLEYLPDRPLRPSVECIWRTEPIVNTKFEIIPDGCVDACFVLSQTNPRVLLFGTTTRTKTYELESGAIYFGVRFRPGKASLFIREKISDLTDSCTEIPQFLGIEAGELLDKKTTDERRIRLQLALSKTLSNTYTQTTALLDHAISQIESRSGDLRVRETARACSVSERQLERLFVQCVGITPKLYMRIRRFRAVLNCLEDPPSQSSPSLADVAATHGYVDQSDLVRDMQGFGLPEKLSDL
jgi:AraC-like DNA-binding protein